MARYIDVEALMKELGIADDCDNCAWNGEGKCMKGEGFADACVAMEDAPTADVRENVRGEWFISSDGRIKCSNCLKIPINEIRIRGNIVYDMIPIKKLMKFCPNCGAEMRGGDAK